LKWEGGFGTRFPALELRRSQTLSLRLYEKAALTGTARRAKFFGHQPLQEL